MSQTVIPWKSPLAVKRWSANLAVDAMGKMYWERKFIGKDENSIIQRKDDLESAAGDTIQFDLSVELRGQPTYGDGRLEGKEESLKFFSDEVYIDQMRKAVSAGGKMSRKRTLHNMRTVARNRLGDYWAAFMDQMIFIYLSGARGINADFLQPLGWNGHAGNPIQAPDSNHMLYGGSAISKASLTAADTMNRDVIERAATKAKMLHAVDVESASMPPITIGGEGHYVMVMSEYQAHDLRVNDQVGWLDIQKAAATAEGRKNKIFTGGLGMINGTVLHSHRSAIRFNDYGASNDVNASRALFLSRQAGAIAYGSTSGMRFDWKEETKDYGNEHVVSAGTIMGIKKTRFNGRDFGVISVDTAAKDPNPQ